MFDDVSTAEPAEILAIRDAAANRLAQMNLDERVAIVSISCRVLLDFGNDEEKLKAAIDELRNAPVPLCRAPATEPLEFSVMNSVVQRMSTLPGQRRIVFISPGFRVPREAQPSLDRLINYAASSKVPIDVLETRTALPRSRLSPFRRTLGNVIAERRVFRTEPAAKWLSRARLIRPSRCRSRRPEIR